MTIEFNNSEGTIGSVKPNLPEVPTIIKPQSISDKQEVPAPKNKDKYVRSEDPENQNTF